MFHINSIQYASNFTRGGWYSTQITRLGVFNNKPVIGLGGRSIIGILPNLPASVEFGGAFYGVVENNTGYQGGLYVGWDASDNLQVIFTNDSLSRFSDPTISFATDDVDSYFYQNARPVTLRAIIFYDDEQGVRRRGQSTSDYQWYNRLPSSRVTNGLIVWTINESVTSGAEKLGTIVRKIYNGTYDDAGGILGISLTLHTSATATTPPSIANTAAPTNWRVGTAISTFNLAVSNARGAILSTSGVIPGITIIPGVLGWQHSGTPTRAGTFDITYTADNRINPAVTRTIRYTVAPAQVTAARPTITAPSTRTVTQLERITGIPVNVTSTESATIAITGLPDGLRWRQRSTGNRGFITGIPTTDDVGRIVATISVTTPTYRTPITQNIVFTVVAARLPMVTAPPHLNRDPNQFYSLIFRYSNAVGNPTIVKPDWASDPTIRNNTVTFTGRAPIWYGGADRIEIFRVSVSGVGGRSDTDFTRMTIAPRTVGPAPRVQSGSTTRVSGTVTTRRQYYYNAEPSSIVISGLPSWVTADVSNNGYILYTITAPTVTATRRTQVTVTVTGTPGASDAIGGVTRTASGTITFIINPRPVTPVDNPPTITLPPGDNRRYYRNEALPAPYFVSARDPDGTAVTLNHSGLPAGFRITRGGSSTVPTLSIAGTPTGAARSYTITFTATSNSITTTETITFVLVDRPTTPGTPTIPAPTVDRQPIVSLDGGDELTVDVGYANGTAGVTTNPATTWFTDGITITPTQVQFRGTAPQQTQAQSATVTITVTGQDGRQVTSVFVINVRAYTAPPTDPTPAANTPPIIQPQGDIAVTQGQDVGTITFRIADPDGDTISRFVLVGALPTGLSQSTSADRTAITVTGTVDAAAVLGAYSVSLQGRDSNNANAQVINFSFVVSAAVVGNALPELSPNPRSRYRYNAGQSVNITITVTDANAGDTLTIDLYSGGVLVTTANQRTYLHSGVNYAKSGNTITLSGTAPRLNNTSERHYQVRYSDGNVNLAQEFIIEVAGGLAGAAPVIQTPPVNVLNQPHTGSLLFTIAATQVQYYIYRVANNPQGEIWSLDSDAATAINAIPGLSIQTFNVGRDTGYQGFIIRGTPPTGTAPAVHTIAMKVTDILGNESAEVSIIINLQAKQTQGDIDITWNLPATAQTGVQHNINFRVNNPSTGPLRLYGSTVRLRQRSLLRSDIGGDNWPNPFTQGWAQLKPRVDEERNPGDDATVDTYYEVTFNPAGNAIGENRCLIEAYTDDARDVPTQYTWILNVSQAANPAPSFLPIQDQTVVRGYSREVNINVFNDPTSENLGRIDFFSPVSWITANDLSQRRVGTGGRTWFEQGITLNPPANITPGTTANCRFRISDAAGNWSGYSNFRVTVDDLNPPPIILAPDRVNVIRGETGYLRATVVNEPFGEPTTIWTEHIADDGTITRTQPMIPGLTASIDGNLVSYIYTPPLNASFGEQGTMWIRAHDGVTRSDHSFKWVVKSQPIITPIDDKSYRQGEVITPFTIEVTDPDGDPIRTEYLTVRGLPDSLTFTNQQVSGVVAENAPTGGYLIAVDYFDGASIADSVYFTITITAPQYTPPEVIVPNNQTAILLIDTRKRGRYGPGDNYGDRLLVADYQAGIRTPDNIFEVSGDASAVFTLDNRDDAFDNTVLTASVQFQMSWSDIAFLDDFGGSVHTGVRFRGFVYNVKNDVRNGWKVVQLSVYGILRNMEATHDRVALQGRFIQQRHTVSETLEKILTDTVLNIKAPHNVSPIASIDETQLELNTAGLQQRQVFGTPQNAVRPYNLLKQVAALDFGRIFTDLQGQIRFQGLRYRYDTARRQPRFTLTEDGEDGNVIVGVPIETRVSRVYNHIDGQLNDEQTGIQGNYFGNFNPNVSPWFGVTTDAPASNTGNVDIVTRDFELQRVVQLATVRRVLVDEPGLPLIVTEEGTRNNIQRAETLTDPGDEALGATMQVTEVERDSDRIVIRATITRNRIGGRFLNYRFAIRNINVIWNQTSGQQHLVARDEASVIAYGEQSHRIQNSAAFDGVDPIEIQNYLNGLLAFTKDPRPIYTVTIDGGASPTNKDLSLTIDAGDPVYAYLPSVELGEDADPALMWVENVKGKVEGMRHTITLTLSTDRPLPLTIPREFTQGILQ